MNQEEIKIGLGGFTKQELVDMFASLKLDVNDKKDELIDYIINADPPLPREEVDDFKALLAANTEPKKKPVVIVKALKPVVSKKPVYIVMHVIKESGTLYEHGSEYAGKFIERFLKGGQIRKRG